MNCINLSFCQHLSCTPAQIVRVPSNVVTSALAQFFSKRVIHGIESQHSFNLVAERWLAKDLFNRGEPVVTQVAAAVRDARRAGSVTTLETPAPGDHTGNGLAERAVGLAGGMARTLKNELEFGCQMQIPPESKNHCLDNWARNHVAEPGHGWVRWEGTVRTVARSRTPHGQMGVRGTSVVPSGSIDRSNEGRR